MRVFSQRLKPFSRVGLAMVLAFALTAQPIFTFILARNVSAQAMSNVVYDALPSVSSPTNYPSVGYAPTGQSGPYNSLNVAVPKNQTVSVGTDNNADEVVVNSTWDGQYGSAGSTGVFRKDTGWGAYGTLAMQITASAPLTITPCATTTTVNSTSLSSWYMGETRATGHNELMANGLHVWTEGATSTDKAAGYYGVNFPLANLGSQTIAESIDYSASVGITPGLQLAMDFNNDGTFDGYLVGESIYGNNWWLSNGAAQFAKDGAPHNGGGNGSQWFGTANEWLNAFPNARVTAIGYSLGSGVHGDGILKRITLGCANYTFGLAVPTNLTPADSTVTNDPAFVDTWSVVEGAHGYAYRTSNTLNGSVLGSIIYSDTSATQPGHYSTSGSTVTRQNGGTPEGDYYWQVSAIDSAGNLGPWSAINKVTVDTTAPATPTLLSPADGALLNYNNFWFDWSDVTGASGYEFQASQSNATDLQGSLTSNVWHGDASGNEPVTSQAWSSGANDTWYWQVRAVDAAGNKSAWTTPWKLTIDMTAPAVPSVTLTDNNGTGVANGGYITTQYFTFHLPSGVARYQLKYWNNVDGSAFKGETNAWNPTDLSGYMPTSTTYKDNFTQGEGVHYFAFSACNAAGNCSAYSAPFAATYDKTAPAIPTNLGWNTSASTAIANGGSTNDENGTASWGASSSSDVDHYIYKYWNDIVGNPYKEVSPWTTSVGGTSLAGAFNQGEGVHYFSVAAVDKAGNTSSFSAPFKITYDKTAPVVTINAVTASTNTPTVTGTVNDPNAIVTLTVNQVDYIAVNNGGTWKYEFTTALADGTYALSVTATDTAGNTSVPQTAIMTVATGQSNAPQNNGNGNVLGANTSRNTATTTTVTPTSTSDTDTATTGQVLAAEDTKTTTTGATDKTADTKSEDSANVGKILGLKWFWWLVILVVIVGLWWLIAAKRRRADDEA